MNTVAQELLKTFDDLPDTEQQVIAAEILKRVINFDIPPMTDEDLVFNAEELFLVLDEQETNDELKKIALGVKHFAIAFVLFLVTA